NGTDYTPVVTISSIRDVTEYMFTDSKAPASRLYYRIRTHELTGQLSYSTIRIVAQQGITASTVKLYPNPVVNNMFTVMIDQPGAKTIKIYNSAGALCQQLSFGETSKDISTEGWPKGYYLLRIILADGSVVTEKIVVQ
ncbi:MAG: T9SS type A sorting domain-containing protein, partial [Chitinophaga rupis]